MSLQWISKLHLEAQAGLAGPRGEVVTPAPLGVVGGAGKATLGARHGRLCVAHGIQDIRVIQRGRVTTAATAATTTTPRLLMFAGDCPESMAAASKYIGPSNGRQVNAGNHAVFVAGRRAEERLHNDVDWRVQQSAGRDQQRPGEKLRRDHHEATNADASKAIPKATPAVCLMPPVPPMGTLGTKASGRKRKPGSTSIIIGGPMDPPSPQHVSANSRLRDEAAVLGQHYLLRTNGGEPEDEDLAQEG
ncbi:hypothetical protein V8C35DRAFT_282368 [Trichoderma chlorosporum]